MTRTSMDLSYFDAFINHVQDKTQQTPCAPPPSPEIKFNQDKVFDPCNFILNKSVERMKWEERYVQYMAERNDLYCELDNVETEIIVNMVLNRLKCLKVNS